MERQGLLFGYRNSWSCRTHWQGSVYYLATGILGLSEFSRIHCQGRFCLPVYCIMDNPLPRGIKVMPTGILDPVESTGKANNKMEMMNSQPLPFIRRKSILILTEYPFLILISDVYQIWHIMILIHYHMGRAKKKKRLRPSAKWAYSDHPVPGKVSSGPLLAINIFCSIQWFC